MTSPTAGPGKETGEPLPSLLEGYRRGEAAAFERFYARLEPEVRAWLLAREDDRAFVDDLVQETFLQVHRARHTWSPSRPVRPWFFAIARHVLATARRGARRRRRREREAYDAARPGAVEPRPRTVEERDMLDRALQHLGTKDREPLVLRHALDCTFAEIGAVLGIRPGTAKVRVHRALAAVRRQLRAEPWGDGG